MKKSQALGIIEPARHDNPKSLKFGAKKVEYTSI